MAATKDIAMDRVFGQLEIGNVGLAITEMETYLAAWPQAQTSEKLNTIKSEYRLMESYWLGGTRDPQLDEQYQRLLQRVYVLSANVAVYRRMKASSYLYGLYTGARHPSFDWSVAAIRREMEGFVSDVAMLQLEQEHLQKEKSISLYNKHHVQMTALFNYIVTSHVWTDSVGKDIEDMLVSPTIDSNDQQLLISAITLSSMNTFDMAKFRLLLNVYRRSQDEAVRQRALVGWVLSINMRWITVYPEMKSQIEELLQSQRVCKELTELQMQFVYTLNAERDTTTIQKEIMPDLLNNNSFRVTRNGVEEIPEDPMEDILNPGASEQRMEQLEATVQRMMDMHKQGSDIYFGGFSQMKRYPFFYDMVNWLVPFYIQHPDLQQFIPKIEGNHFVERLISSGPFCNSDKYSFVIAFQSVFDRLPEQMRDLLKQGEASIAEMELETAHSAAYVRRIYLMDLYRFFRLFPNRSVIRNPFDTQAYSLGDCDFFSLSIFKQTPLESYKREIVRMLKKQKYDKAASYLLSTFPHEMQDVQYYLWSGEYDRVLDLDPDNERALVGNARKQFHSGHYEEAEEMYDRLLLLHPGKKSYMLNKAVCLLHVEEYEDALKLLYQLNYEHEEDDNINRVLAWTLTCAGKLDQADNLYRQLIQKKPVVSEDFQNYGYCLWLQGKIEKAAESLRKFYEMEENKTDDFLFAESEWLIQRGISETEIKMMAALVSV